MNNKSKFLWLYSIVLFTIAFVLIFMSGVSQSRLSKDVKTFKEQLSEQQGLFQGVQKSLSALIEENEQYKKTIKEKEEQLKQFQMQINELNKQLNEIEQQKNTFIESIDNLLEAKNYYNDKKYIESALYLEHVNYEILNVSSKKLYNSFASIVLEKAANIYYSRGYENYKKHNFNDAIENFTKSLKYKKDVYFSDDAMFFLAVSMYKINQVDEAKKQLLQLKEKYPVSTYKKEVDRFLSSIEQEN